LRPEQSATATVEAIDDEQLILNFGPQHPAMHGTLRVVLKVEGEKIISGEPDIGFLHTGFEKLGEAWTYTQWIVTTDRMNYLSPVAKRSSIS
jgi:NADH-quinone oxidoreductase subunit D